MLTVDWLVELFYDEAADSDPTKLVAAFDAIKAQDGYTEACRKWQLACDTYDALNSEPED